MAHSRFPAGVRLFGARHTGAMAAWASRRAHLGSGSVIGGRVMLRLAPDALAQLSKHRLITLVSGTNGKTSTTAFLAAALRTRVPVVTNAAGANMPAGIAAAFAHGPGGAIGVLEVDEFHLPRVFAQTSPRIVVLGNLSRDQLDRVGEVTMVADRWRECLASARDVTVVANADDPEVVWAAELAPRKVWVSAGQVWGQDSVTCTHCGALLDRAGAHWSCACGNRRPDPDWTWEPKAEGARVSGPKGGASLHLRLPGRINYDNATLAVAAAVELGVPLDDATWAMGTLPNVAHRYSATKIDGQPVRLLLGKNPAGWSALLELLSPPPAPVVVAVNCRDADGRDASWLWDVPFEHLRGRSLIATGERRADLAVRLLHAEVHHVTTADPWRWLRENGHQGERIDVVASYTAFMNYTRRAHAN